jgi:4-amino-4-deoxy-L-arabinose transferase-like glycosyltransferase
MFLSQQPVAEKTTPRRTLLLFCLCVVSFIAFRVRWIGHLLTWDEAMNLCSIRSFVSPGTDVFSFWFWRHPPLLFFFALPLAPLKLGFAERVEMLSVLVGVITLAMLFLLNRKVFGERVALWSCFLLSVMPSSMFYDVWLKRDAPVAALGLAAILLVVHSRPLLAGLCLGGALLAKETAVFYVGAALLMWLLAPRQHRWRQAAGMLLVAFAVAGWWYLGVKSSVDGVVSQAVKPAEAVGLLVRLGAGFSEHLQFAMGADRWSANWAGAWHYYLSRLPHDLGWLGFVLAVAGAILSILRWVRGGAREVCWPLVLLVPALAVLSALPGKVPWVPICLYPAWATLAAFGADSVARAVRARGEGSAATVGLTALLVVQAVTLSYERMLAHDGSRQLVPAQNSRQIAEVLNGLVTDSDRVLLTSFHHWQGPKPGYVCPVFTSYLQRKPAILIRSHLLSFDAYLADIREHRIDWALLSPPPGPEAQALFEQFRALGLTPCRLPGGFVFRTSSLHGEG